jgi:hypothetical protein
MTFPNLLEKCRPPAAAVAGLAAWFALGTGAASALGTMNIQRVNGTADTYQNVRVKVLHGAMYVTSADGSGTIVINDAGCYYQGKIIICLPTSVVLVQGGSARALDLATGTIYLNYTDDDQPLLLTSRKLPAHGVLMSFRTTSNTYVGLSGSLDQVIRR